LKNLILYSGLLELWNIFETIVSISPLDSNGFFTMTMTNDYLKDYPKQLNVTHYEFWDFMSYCLMRENKKLAIDRKQKAKAAKQRGGR